jgi:hypothetical protein
MFQTKSFRENKKTHFMFNNVLRKLCRLRDNVEKYGRARQATDGNIIRHREDTICMPGNQGKNTDARLILKYYCFSTAKLLSERASLLRCTCIASLVKSFTAAQLRSPFLWDMAPRRWVIGAHAVSQRGHQSPNVAAPYPKEMETSTAQL